MTFYINPCSLQFNTNDQNLQLFRKIIFSVIIFEIVFVMVLRIMSGLKNYDLQIIRKQLEDKKKIEEKAIFQTIQSLNDLTQHNQTIITLIKNTPLTAKSMKEIKKESFNENGIDKIILKKDFQKRNEVKQIQKERQEKKSQYSNSSDESQATQQNDEWQMELFAEQTQNHELHLGESMNFINVLNIKLSQAEASNFFNIVLGHFFISASLSIPHSPSIFSTAFACLHGILFVLLILISACIKIDTNKVANQIQSESKKDNSQHQRNISSNLTADENAGKKNDQSVKNDLDQNKRPLKNRISLLIMVLMSLINLSLLAISITQIKQSYFNPLENKCQ